MGFWAGKNSIITSVNWHLPLQKQEITTIFINVEIRWFALDLRTVSRNHLRELARAHSASVSPHWPDRQHQPASRALNFDELSRDVLKCRAMWRLFLVAATLLVLGESQRRNFSTFPCPSRCYCFRRTVRCMKLDLAAVPKTPLPTVTL